MTSRKIPIEIHRFEPEWLIIAALCLIAWPHSLFSQEIQQWEKAINEADRLRHLGQYQEAEKSYLSALEEAAKFGSQDPRLAKSLNDLAALYKRQGKYTEAEPLNYRALAIWEKTLGPEHEDFAAGLTTWPFSVSPKAATRKLSRCIGDHWPFGRRHWVRNTPMWRPT